MWYRTTKLNERKRGSFPYAKQPLANQLTSLDYHNRKLEKKRNTKAKNFSVFQARFLHGLVWFALPKRSNLGWAQQDRLEPFSCPPADPKLSPLLCLTLSSSSWDRHSELAGSGPLQYHGRTMTVHQEDRTECCSLARANHPGSPVDSATTEFNHVLSNEALQVEGFRNILNFCCSTRGFLY